MADRKITDLTALAAGSQATGDLLTIVDVSEGAAADKNKKITVESLFKGIPGNVGIGTSSPGQLLQVGVPNSATGSFRAGASLVSIDAGFQSSNVIGTAAAPALIFGGDSNTGYWHPASDTLAVSTAGNERLRIDSSGNVGIGCDNPQYQIDLSASDVDHLFTGAINAEQDGGDYALKLTALGKSGGRTGSVRFITGQNTSSGSERMRIDSSGNVGIGTTTIGSASLTLYGSGSRTMYQGSSTGTGNGNGFTTGNNGAADAFLWNYENGFVQVATNNTERLRIDSSGNAGLGRSSASCRLHIATSVANASSPVGMQIGNDGSGSGTGASISLGAGNAAASTAGNIAGFFDGTGTALSFSTSSNYGVSTYAERMRIDSSGNLKFNSGFGSVGTAYGCRAWVNFNGTGTVAIRDSGNVSSITDNGTGNYTIAFTTAMPDANYCVVTTSSYATGVTESMFTTVNGDALFTTGGFNAKSRDDGGTLRDVNYFFAAVFR